MNFFKKDKGKQRDLHAVFFLTFLIIIVLLIAPKEANATDVGSVLAAPFKWIGSAVAGTLTGISDIGSDVVGLVIYGVSYLFVAFESIFIAIQTYTIAVLLQLNNEVVGSLAVQSGFSITLAIANLGFILGIIVIALATILHRETYGLKKLLWKLVIAAILVNFSLVIGGAIINVAGLLTNSFMVALPGGGGGVSGYFAFANDLAGAFAPHRLGLTGFLTNGSSTVQGTAQQAGSGLASLITPLFGLIFVMAMLFVITITLTVFLFMLLIRYITLSILLIIMPLAWLFWIFPKTSHLWSKWWGEFLRWTFFAPIVMFFLYLAIATAGAMSSANLTGGIGSPAAGLQALGYTASSNTPILSSISTFLGSIANTLIGSFLQMLVVVGLAAGGIYAANKLSIMGSKEAMGAMKGGAKAAGTWAAKTGARNALNFAARRANPSRTTPSGGVYTPLTRMARLRSKVSQGFQNAASGPGFSTNKGLAASVWEGVKKGSGLFGKKTRAWECQNCVPTGHVPPRREHWPTKPTIACHQCHATAAVANWKEVHEETHH